jgi:hypothetical protein
MITGAGYVDVAASYVPMILKVNIGGLTLNLESIKGIQGYLENYPISSQGATYKHSYGSDRVINRRQIEGRKV